MRIVAEPWLPGGLGRVLKVRPDEGRTAVLGVGAIMSAAVGATFGQSGADALFFARAGVDELPVMLLLSGALMFVGSFALTAILGRVSPARLFVALPLAVAGIVLVERILVAVDVQWIYPVLWLTVGVAQMVQGLFTWGTYGIVVDTRQAKRLFPLFGAGWILGWVVGGVVTRPLATVIGAENLLFVWAGGLVAAYAFGRALLGGVPRRRGVATRRSSRPTPGLLDEMQQGFRSVRRSPLMRWMSVAALLFSVLFYSLYLPFSQAATERFADADALAGFFGLFSAVTAGAALLWSLLLTGRLFSRFGVTTMLLMFPVLYLAGFGALIVSTSFAAIVVVRFVQMLWLQSVANPAWEAVVNVMPPTRRDQTRAFLNGAPAQAGTVIAGAIQVVGAQAMSPRSLSAIGAGAAAAGTFACWRIRGCYTEALIDALRAGRPQVFPTAADEQSLLGARTDAEVVAVLVAGTTDADPRVRRAAVEVLGEVPAAEAGPALEAALEDDDETVRAAALRALAGSADADVWAGAVRSLSDPQDAVRAEAVRAVERLAGGAPDRVEPIRDLLADEAPEVRSAAASAMLRTASYRDALGIVGSLLRSGDQGDRALAMEALRGPLPPEAFDVCVTGLADTSPRVRSAAALALAEADGARAVPVLVDLLADPDPDVVASTSAALGRIGPPARAPVLDALTDPARVEGALRSLAGHPIDDAREVLLEFSRSEGARAVADFEAARAIERDGDAARLLADSLVERARRRARNALRSLALLDGRAMSGIAIDNLAGRDPVQVANALEALDSLARPSIVRPLLRLWESAPPLEVPREDWLPSLLDDPDPWIRECARSLLETTRGEPMSETGVGATLSEMERVLFLRKVSLFAELAPRDLTRVAAVARERTYADGETIAGQGETGDELHIVVAGRVRVLRAGGTPGDEAEIAVRSTGDVVGEMALITHEPRMASLVAAGDVRTLQVGRREFESVLRERPDTAISLIRILSQRLVESARGRDV